MKFVKKKIANLIPADYNPRKDLKPGDPDYEKLKHSMKEFGYVDPIIWNQQTGRVVGGHQRLKILQDEGLKEAECVVVNLDEEKEKALNIALNKISGDWDKDKLALLMTDLQASDLDISLTGFDEDEISDLLATEDDTHDDDFDIDSELDKPTFSKPGDLWHLGKHTLLCGDATKTESYQKLLGDHKVNLVLTDPPYNVDYSSKAGKIKNDHQADDKFYQFLLAAFQNMNQAIANDASIYVFHADTEGLNFRRAFQDAGFYLSGCCIWKKQSLVLGRSPISGNMNPYSMDGRKMANTNGTPGERNPPSGNLIAQSRVRNTQR